MGAERDFQYELHMEECAHGQTLMYLDLARAALEKLADPKRWDEGATGRVTWLHLDGVTKPWDIANSALHARETD